MVIRSELVFSKSLVQVSLTWFNTSVRHIRTTGTPKKKLSQSYNGRICKGI